MAKQMRLTPWPSLEIARTRAARSGTAPAKVPFQIVLLKFAIKVEWCLTGRLLHCKREVALSINGSLEWICSLGRRSGHKRSAQGSIPLALPYKHREGCCLLRYLIKH